MFNLDEQILSAVILATGIALAGWFIDIDVVVKIDKQPEIIGEKL
jgi:hypothetical protein